MVANAQSAARLDKDFVDEIKDGIEVFLQERPELRRRIAKLDLNARGLLATRLAVLYVPSNYRPFFLEAATELFENIM